MGALAALGRPVRPSMGQMVSLLTFGLVFIVAYAIVAVWLYAAIRPRYGAGPRTALISGIVVWLLSVAAPVTHLAVFGVASVRFVLMDLPAECILILVASLVGARQYEK